ncbi:ABC transporter ATP-binding protein [Actinopolyspora mortivallis]|uniref:ABC transporter ATP-binding protein n=1 Tax=Actinopolyspora mortivallis TaxID=33906 RepID=UPI0003699CAC|nr:ABC transporter ATP-binding protein [Actinopolyspora mortivallis]
MHVTLDGVSVHHAGATLVRDLTLHARGGEVLGLVGPNGSGKSTALRCVYRAIRPSSGTVWLGNTRLEELSPGESARTVAAVTQGNEVGLDFTVAETVAMGRFPHPARSRDTAESVESLCRAAMLRTDIADLAGRGLLSLSGGQRQRVMIARALVQQPNVLVLDEPTNHLDVRHRISLLRYLRECGLTVLVALHDLNLAALCCDRIAVFGDGSVTSTGTPAEVLTPETVRRVFGVTPDVVPHPRTGVPQLHYALDAENTEGNDS